METSYDIQHTFRTFIMYILVKFVKVSYNIGVSDHLKSRMRRLDHWHIPEQHDAHSTGDAELVPNYLRWTHSGRL
jgi:hypothetical protein